MVTVSLPMTLDAFLQFLNLPILGGVLYVAYVAGTAASELKEHRRRLQRLEDQVWPAPGMVRAEAD